MKLRTQLLGGVTLLVLLPLLALAFGIRHEMGRRLTGQFTGRVDALVGVVESELTGTDRDLRARLDALRETLRDDNTVRRCLLEGHEELRPHVLDWAGRAMSMTGLDLLQVQERTGRIVSSGHFRNEYDRVDRNALDGLTAHSGTALVTARRPEGTFLALARADSLRLGPDRYFLVAGIEVDEDLLRALSPDPDLVVSLSHPGGAVSPDAALQAQLASGGSPSRERQLVRAIAVPTTLPDAEGAPAATFYVTHSLAPRDEILRSLDRWLLAAWLLAAGGGVLLAVRISGRITRPIEELADKTAGLDLDRLDTDFASDRRDEVGRLSRFLDEMSARLRASVVRVQDAERRATRGELARQVNHDLRNAFTPIRNVVRHLTQVAAEEPRELPRVYGERRETLEAGLDYVDELAGNWKRIAQRTDRGPCDLEAVARQVVAGRTRDDGGPVRLTLRAGGGRVLADPVGVRRIVENLVANACESLEGGRGDVEVTVQPDRMESGTAAVRLVVRDDGCGIPPDDLDRIFDDFYTTKPSGNGLGLSVVRRLVSDFEGTLHVSSRPGAGTTFTVRLPAAAAGPEEPR